MLMRRYRPESDYDLVDRFLVECFVPGNRLHAWLQPRWEYMHGSSAIDSIVLEDIGIAEDAGRIVGVVHPEHSPAFVYLQMLPDRPDVLSDLLDWAETHLGGWSRNYQRDLLGVFCNDAATADELDRRGFDLAEDRESHSIISLVDPIPDARIPTGYRIQSLADNNDLEEVNRVLWRGFAHDGPPSTDETPGRLSAQQTPNYSLDRNIVAVAPDGHFAAYAGIWFEPNHQIAYVEPVATDPDHRHLGLGRGVVFECLRRVRDAGASVAWVGSDQEFYRRIGFEVTCASELWIKEPKRP